MIFTPVLRREALEDDVREAPEEDVKPLIDVVFVRILSRRRSTCSWPQVPPVRQE